MAPITITFYHIDFIFLSFVALVSFTLSLFTKLISFKLRCAYTKRERTLAYGKIGAKPETRMNICYLAYTHAKRIMIAIFVLAIWRKINVVIVI